ncbi:MAG: polysaccharide deacetylase family protein [Defluviitaleaceae bacterium]|nr:polysaccharide deacetylase family protein [Defluviitaleaceae bacterium]
MKKIFYYLSFLIVILITLSACTGRYEPQTEDNTTILETEPINEHLNNPYQSTYDAMLLRWSSKDLTIEYGEADMIASNEPPFYAYIRFPYADNFADETIFNWSYEQYRVARDEFYEHQRIYSDSEAEINIHFESFLVEERYVGIVQFGDINASYFANSRDILKTFNLDLDTSQFLDSNDILDFSRIDVLTELLKSKIELAYPNEINFLDSDNNWFENILITHEGILVKMEGGLALPNYLGMISILLPYEELADLLLLTSYKNQEDSFNNNSFANLVSIEATINEERIIDPSRPMVALTFDDGPNKHTLRILDILEEHNSRASFFVIGNLIDSRRETIIRAHAMGNEVFGHSWDHKNLANLSSSEIRQQLNQTHQALESAIGETSKLFRPPFGVVNDNVRNIAREMGFTIINWSVDTRDWQNRNANSVYNSTMNDIRDGSIILYHDIYESTAEAIERIVPELISNGYQLVTLSELFMYKEIEVTLGAVITRGY